MERTKNAKVRQKTPSLQYDCCSCTASNLPLVDSHFRVLCALQFSHNARLKQLDARLLLVDFSSIYAGV